MNYVYLSMGVPILTYFGYVFGRRKFYEYIMSKVNEELDKRLKKEDEEEFFRATERSAKIRVSHGGKLHDVYVPYDRSKSTSMLRKKVYLIRNGEKVDITQKPGIPYLVTAHQLGGTSIQIEDLSGKIIQTYSENETPNYL